MKAIGHVKRLNALQTRMVMQDLYETEYGIYNHLSQSKKKPLASVAMFASEDINDGSLLEEVIRTYHYRKIYDIFHISLIEFLELPFDIVQMLYQIADEENSKKNNAITDLEKEFKV